MSVTRLELAITTLKVWSITNYAIRSYDVYYQFHSVLTRCRLPDCSQLIQSILTVIGFQLKPFKAHIPHISQPFGSGWEDNLFFTPLVLPMGLEPIRFSATDFESVVSAVPPREHIIESLTSFEQSVKLSAQQPKTKAKSYSCSTYTTHPFQRTGFRSF